MKIDLREITAIDNREIKKALELMNRTQGEGLFKNSYLESKIEDSNSLVLMVFIQDELVSVGCAEIIETLDYYTPFDESIKKRLKGKKIGSLCTLCVKEEFQGRGIGQKVTKERMKWLHEKKCDFVLGISWQSGNPITSDKLFQKNGFQQIKEIKDFFVTSSIKYCPGCKELPCRCSAILFEYTF